MREFYIFVFFNVMHDKTIIAINQPIDFIGGTLEVSHATDDFISFLII